LDLEKQEEIDFTNKEKLRQIINKLNYSEIIEVSKDFLNLNLLLTKDIPVYRPSGGKIKENDEEVFNGIRTRFWSIWSSIFSQEFSNLTKFEPYIKKALELSIQTRDVIRKYSINKKSIDIIKNISLIFRLINKNLIQISELFEKLRDINKDLFGWLINSENWRSDIFDIINFNFCYFYNFRKEKINSELFEEFFKIFLEEAITYEFYSSVLESDQLNQILIIEFKKHLTLWITDLKRSAEDIVNALNNTLKGNNIQKRLEYLIKKNEDSHFDRKEAVSDTIMKLISAFANTEGGIILIGQADDKRIVGIDNFDRRIQTINQHANNIQPSVVIKIFEHEYKEFKLIEVQIPKSSKLHQCHGKYYKRVHRDCIPMNHYEVVERLKG